MVHKPLIEALEEGNEQKIGLGVFWTFLKPLRRCFDAVVEISYANKKENAMDIIKEEAQRAFTDAELNIRETLMHIYNNR